MLKASALYLVILIALIIALLCSSLLVAAGFYRAESIRKARYDQLETNLESGINLMLSGHDSSYLQKTMFALFGEQADSITLQKIHWGIYDIGISKAFIQGDTLTRVFSMGRSIDSGSRAAIYLADQDRPLSLSGATSIAGDAFLPKAGVKKAFVDGHGYQGDDRLVTGKIKNSQKTLPALDQARIKLLQNYLSTAGKNTAVDSAFEKADTLRQSFLKATRVINLGRRIHELRNQLVSGNIILYSDTTLTVDASVSLDGILVFAKAIVVKSGFQGRCQLFASDSIHVQAGCRFQYPSCLAVFNPNSSKISPYVRITIDKNTAFSGTIVTYRQSEEEIMPVLALDSNVTVSGQIYSQGMLQYKDGLHVNGGVFTKLFTYQSGYNLMENMLINSTISSKALSPYYLSGELFQMSNRKKVLQWLE
ncbi:MAG TPA: hypothetical protein VIM89_05015 [Mucilaginibacter sp.]